MTTDTAPARSRRTPRGGLGGTLALVAVAQLIVSLDYNIVYVALPEIGRAVGLDQHTLQWVVSAYALAFGGALLLGGRACDVHGPRRVLLLGLACYGLASLTGGLASDAMVLLASRAVQGVGGALLFPATLTLVGTLFPEGPERRRAYAVWGTAGGSGMILGSLLGGVLTAHLGWASVFFVNVPLAALALAAGARLVPSGPAPAVRRRIDLAGAATSAVGVVAVVFAIEQGSATGWSSVPALAAALLAPVAVLVFVAVERRSRDPLLPLQLLRHRDLRTGSLVAFLFMGTFGALLYFLTVYFQSVQGFDALQTGLAFLVPMLAIVLGSQATTAVAGRFGYRVTMILGLATGGLGALVLAVCFGAETPYYALVPGLVVFGLGQGAAYTTMFGAAVVGVPDADRGVASGVVSTSQQMGGAVGLATLVAVAAGGVDDLEGIRLALVGVTVGIAATCAVALGYTRHSASHSPHDSAE